MGREIFSDDIVELEKLLRWVCTAIKRKGRDIIANFEITPPQFDALLQLIRNGDLTISELSAKMFLACSTITDLIDRMEKSGLVERIRDTKDRRVVRIKVLEKGHRLIEEVLDARREYLENVLYDLDIEEKQALNVAFKMIYERMDEDLNCTKD